MAARKGVSMLHTSPPSLWLMVDASLNPIYQEQLSKIGLINIYLMGIINNLELKSWLPSRQIDEAIGSGKTTETLTSIGTPHLPPSPM
jgi:hypothetical protein